MAPIAVPAAVPGAGAATDTLASADAVAAGVPWAQATIAAATPTAIASAAKDPTNLLIMLIGRRRARIGCSSDEKRLPGVRLRLRCYRWKGRAVMTNADSTDMVPVTIIGVAVAPGEHSDRRERFSIVLASAADGDARRLLIGVGDAEATALAFSLQGQEFPRPMTYQFMAALLAAAGSAVRAVRVTRTDGQVFYAQVTLRGGAVVDARPSDAINLAAITGAPVLVASELLDLPVDPELRVP